MDDSLRFTNCDFRYGGDDGYRGTVMNYHNAALFENCSFIGGETAGLYSEGGAPNVTGCDFSWNNYALDFQAGASASGVSGNQIGPQNAIISPHAALIAPASCMDELVDQNDFTARQDDRFNALAIWGSTILESQTWPTPPDSFVYYIPDGQTITVAGASSPVLHLQPGTIVKSYNNMLLQIGAGGLPGGLIADQVVFTSLYDDEGGDTSGSPTEPTYGHWRRVLLNAEAMDDSLRFTNCDFRYGGDDGYNGTVMNYQNAPLFENCDFISSETAGLYSDGGEPYLVHSAFHYNNIGLRLVGNARPVITALCFEGNSSYGLQTNTFTDGLGNLSAPDCWWGAIDGPGGVGSGSGDPVSPEVDYIPWAMAPVCGSEPTAIDGAMVPIALTTIPYPNPFNPQTTIRFELPETRRVHLRIFDLQGHLVRELVSDPAMGPGRFERVWNGQDEGGRTVASGAYLYSLRAGSEVVTRRLLLLK